MFSPVSLFLLVTHNQNCDNIKTTQAINLGESFRFELSRDQDHGAPIPSSLYMCHINT